MNKETRNRIIHITGMTLCLLALLVTGGITEMKSAITVVIAGFGFIGNAYGILRPTALLS